MLAADCIHCALGHLLWSKSFSVSHFCFGRNKVCVHACVRACVRVCFHACMPMDVCVWGEGQKILFLRAEGYLPPPFSKDEVSHRITIVLDVMQVPTNRQGRLCELCLLVKGLPCSAGV